MEITNMYHLIYYFIIYSFMGWVVESTFKSLLFKKPINSGFLHGPFIPIYGVGAVIVITCLEPFANNLLLLFILGFILMTIMEYIVGSCMESMFNTSWWDYSSNFMNINGKVCLENSIYWGLLSIFLLKFLHPSIEMLVMLIPNNIMLIPIIIFTIYFFADYIITLVEVLNLQQRIKILQEKMDSIKLKYSEELKFEIVDLKEKILKRSKRLLRIYPKLTYLKINRRLRDIVSEIKEKNRK